MVSPRFPLLFVADDVDLAYVVTLTPEKAVEYLRSKGVRVTERWTDLWEAAHNSAFTISGVASEDLLKEAQAALAKSIGQGHAFPKAAADLADVLSVKGWTGKSGRIKTILLTNTGNAYGAARKERQERNAKNRPYWMYDAKMDALTRPAHAALNGQVWAADDPIWQTIYPPNGFNCRCKVRALSELDLERRGLKVNGKSTVKAERAQVRVDKVTGERVIREVHTARWTGPDGKRHNFQPDDGWGHAPGDIGYRNEE